jgi:hypothetical protein
VTNFAKAGGHVIFETIDGEAVVINLDNGNYYSLRGVSAVVWSALTSGHSVEETAAALSNRLSGDSTEITTYVQELCDELRKEELIKERGDALPEPIDWANVGEGNPFVPTKLERYDDMQDLILLDPIHEVDQQEGWPAKA